MKDDSKCASVEMVYGTTLRFLGQLFSATPAKTFGDDFVCGSAYIKDGKFAIQFACAVSKTHIRAKTFTDPQTRFCVGFSRDPHTATFIQRTFKVLKRHPKFFEVEIKNSTEYCRRLVETCFFGCYMAWRGHFRKSYTTTCTKRYKRDCD